MKSRKCDDKKEYDAMVNGNTGIRAFGAPSIGDFFWSSYNILKMVLPKQFSKVYISFWN
jgi:hypothetical protein